MKRILEMLLMAVFTSGIPVCWGQEIVKDRDGNVYQTIKAGKQVWMAENLKVTRYRNGDPIPGMKDQKQWEALSGGARSTAIDDPALAKKFGQIYNWYVIADPRNVCPAGWHVPSEAEWVELLTFLAGEPLSPFKTSAPLPAQNRAINEHLFSVLPVDYFRGYDLECSHAGYGGGAWWSSTPATAETAYYHGINYDTPSKNRLEGSKKFGYSIRCVKD